MLDHRKISRRCYAVINEIGKIAEGEHGPEVYFWKTTAQRKAHWYNMTTNRIGLDE